MFLAANLKINKNAILILDSLELILDPPEFLTSLLNTSKIGALLSYFFQSYNMAAPNATPAPNSTDELRTRIIDLNALLRINKKDLKAQKNVELEVNTTPQKQKVLKKAAPDLSSEIFYVVNQRDHAVYEYGDVLKPRAPMAGDNVKRENVFFNMLRETPNEVLDAFDAAGNIVNKTRFHQGYHCAKPNPQQGEQARIAALDARITALEAEKDDLARQADQARQAQQAEIDQLEARIAAVRVAAN